MVNVKHNNGIVYNIPLCVLPNPTIAALVGEVAKVLGLPQVTLYRGGGKLIPAYSIEAYQLTDDSTLTTHPEATASECRRYWAYSVMISNATYHIPESERYLPPLYERAFRRGFYIVQGGFRTGKSSHLNALQHAIKDRATPIRFTLRDGTDLDAEFFSWIVGELKRADIAVTTITSYTDLETVLAPFTNIVFLIDEAQALAFHPQASSFLGWLKSFSERKSEQFLSAFAFGTFSSSLLVRQNEECCPFHLDNILYMCNLSKEQTISLYSQWATDVGITITEDVLEELYSTSGGYPGLVGLLGVQLQEIDFASSKVLDYDKWIERVRVPLVRMIPVATHFARIVNHQTPESKACVQLLLASVEPFFFPEEYTSQCIELADHGVLSMFDTDGTTSARWYFTSPLYKELLIGRLASHIRPSNTFFGVREG